MVDLRFYNSKLPLTLLCYAFRFAQPYGFHFVQSPTGEEVSDTTLIWFEKIQPFLPLYASTR